MAVSVGRVHHASLAATLYRISLVNRKKVNRQNGSILRDFKSFDEKNEMPPLKTLVD